MATISELKHKINVLLDLKRIYNQDEYVLEEVESRLKDALNDLRKEEHVRAIKVVDKALKDKELF